MISPSDGMNSPRPHDDDVRLFATPSQGRFGQGSAGSKRTRPYHGRSESLSERARPTSGPIRRAYPRGPGLHRGRSESLSERTRPTFGPIGEPIREDPAYIGPIGEPIREDPGLHRADRRAYPKEPGQQATRRAGPLDPPRLSVTHDSLWSRCAPFAGCRPAPFHALPPSPRRSWRTAPSTRAKKV